MKKLSVLMFATLLLASATLLAQPQPTGAGGATALAALHDAAPVGTTSTAAVAPGEETIVAAPDNAVPDVGEGTAPSADAAGENIAADATGDVTADVASDGGEPEPTIGEIVKGAGDTFDIWKTQGWIAGMTALIYLLIQITKVGFIKGLLGVRKWLRPLIALVLGLAGAVFASMAGGVVWWSALLGGIGAALGSSGFNELLNTTTATGRAKSTG